MISAGLLKRARRLPVTDRTLLARTAVNLGLAALMVRWLPFRRVMATAELPLAPVQGPADLPQRLVWAVEAGARHLPWRIVCFQKGLALHWMLRRAGFPSLLHYGVGQNGARGLTAHVWVSLHGRILVGADEAAAHACLATYPSGAREP